MRTGFSPATYRRNIPLRKLGRQLNPFPLVQLPYHRLVNPWTMGAILHEVSHNLQNELELERAVPRAILRSAARAPAQPTSVARIWARWNREIFGDMVGCMLGGEAFVASLMDVIGRSPRAGPGLLAARRAPDAVPADLPVHASCCAGWASRTPPAATSEAWRALYPSTAGTTIPRALLRTWPAAVPAVVDAVCYTRFPSLGDKSLREVITFEPRHQLMIEEAAGRLATGIDPGVVPGAVPHRCRPGRPRPSAGLARSALMRNFYHRAVEAVTHVPAASALHELRAHARRSCGRPSPSW